MKKVFRSFIAVILTLVMLALMIGTTSVNAATTTNEPVGAQQKAMFIMDTVNISQGMYGSYSHQGSKAIDLAGKDGGTDPAYAPFDGKVVYMSTSAAYIIYQSLNPVEFADGTVDYMTVWVMHDDNVGRFYVGQTFSQGQHFFNEGSSGYATGNHIHLECAKGTYEGQYKNDSGVWCIKNQINPYDALFLSESTHIINGYGYNWRRTNNIVIPQGSQTISDGDYHIVTMLDDNKALDVFSANNADGTNIDIYANINSPEQVFTITYLGNGCYKIIHKNSGKSLDCKGAGTTPYTNVQTWAYDGSDQQQWIIQPSEDNRSFYIISKKSGLCLDVNNASSENFTNVQIFTPNQSTAQKWKFIAWGADTGRTVSDGEYHISSKLNPEMCIDVLGAKTENKTNIDLFSNISSPEQVFTVTYLNDGYYKIINKNSGKSLDIDGGECTSGTNIQQFDYENADQQKWIIKPTPDGKSFNIISKKGGLCIDIQDGTATNFNNIQAYLFNGTDAQKWNFIAWSDDSQNIIKNGDYQIISQNDNSKTISVNGNSYSNSANISLENNSKSNWQIFSINYIGEGYYTITNKETGKCLDCKAAGCVSGTNVQQYFYDNVNQQKWIFKKTGNQTFSIQSKASGLFLTAENNSNINVQVGNTQSNQQWIVKPLYDIGDTNLDGIISISDVTAIQRHLAELEVFIDEQLSVADTNADGKYDIDDATHLQMYLAEYDVKLG